MGLLEERNYGSQCAGFEIEAQSDQISYTSITQEGNDTQNKFDDDDNSDSGTDDDVVNEWHDS